MADASSFQSAHNDSKPQLYGRHRRIVVRGVRREPLDVAGYARALMALAEQQLEAEPWAPVPPWEVTLPPSSAHLSDGFPPRRHEGSSERWPSRPGRPPLPPGSSRLGRSGRPPQRGEGSDAGSPTTRWLDKALVSGMRVRFV